MEENIVTEMRKKKQNVSVLKDIVQLMDTCVGDDKETGDCVGSVKHCPGMTKFKIPTAICVI